MEKLTEIIAYFFGQGETVEFKNFTLAHFLPIIIMIGIIFLIHRYSEKIKDYKHEDRIRLALAFILIITEMSYFWRLIGVPSLNPNPHEHLPITICGWGVIFCSYLIITKNQTLFDITYFWLFSGTIFALVTPTVISYCGPTRFRYYQFWLEHSLGYITIFYMIFVHKMRPNIKSMFKSYGAFTIMAFIAFMANKMLGTGANYLFMAELEETASILDLLPTNFVLRVLIMASIVSFMYIVSYIPWFIKDQKNKKLEIKNVKE
jgi:hypothetical integral membrane protein (TIGR02206 family)